MRAWRALAGPEQDVVFRQEHRIRSRNRVCRRPREPEMIAYRLLGVRERWDGCGAHTASRDRGGATAAG